MRDYPTAEVFRAAVEAKLRDRASTPSMAVAQQEEVNKVLARRFDDEVWFSRNLAAVDELVDSSYVVHDIGDRKGVQEPADEQKLTAECFWNHGAMSGSIDFQIAEGDLVANPPGFLEVQRRVRVPKILTSSFPKILATCR